MTKARKYQNKIYLVFAGLYLIATCVGIGLVFVTAAIFGPPEESGITEFVVGAGNIAGPLAAIFLTFYSFDKGWIHSEIPPGLVIAFVARRKLETATIFGLIGVLLAIMIIALSSWIATGSTQLLSGIRVALLFLVHAGFTYFVINIADDQEKQNARSPKFVAKINEGLNHADRGVLWLAQACAGTPVSVPKDSALDLLFERMVQTQLTYRREPNSYENFAVKDGDNLWQIVDRYAELMRAIMGHSESERLRKAQKSGNPAPEDFPHPVLNFLNLSKADKSVFISAADQKDSTSIGTTKDSPNDLLCRQLSHAGWAEPEALPEGLQEYSPDGGLVFWKVTALGKQGLPFLFRAASQQAKEMAEMQDQERADFDLNDAADRNQNSSEGKKDD